MIEIGSWIARFETELARELGQPVSVSPGGEAPEPAHSYVNVLEVAGARMVLAAERNDVAGLLVEGRVIEPDSANEGMVGELWTGILASVAARMGGIAGTDGAGGAEPPFPSHPCRVGLGEAMVRMTLDVVEKESVGRPVETERSREEPGRVPPAGGEEKRNGTGGRYDLLLEVELEAVVRFGSRSLELRELLELGPGDVVELDRQVTDPVDLIVGDKIVARGEVVLVDGNFGLRVTEVAEPVRRLESIRCTG
ncbi:MAG TPA: FliM/FliN family flagellar motor switch protein [Acidobacteriaceae bacterium]|nr:FliM/FliN family flagellar motor switch protein [Acidobacteriaceae bacterium]